MKNYLSIILIIAYIIIYPSCGKDVPLVEENGVIVSLPYEWKRQLHKRNQFNSNSIIDAHLVYNGNPIIATTEGDGDRWINLIDIETGKDIWKWNDNFWGKDEKFSIQDAHFYNNLMTYQVGGRSYCINLDNGNTHWKIQEDRSFHSRVSGIDNYAFLLGPPKDTLDGYTTYVGYEREMNTGSVNQFLFTDIDFNSGGEANRITRIFNIEPYRHIDGRTYLVVVSYDALPNWQENQFVGLYDYDNQVWVYNRKMISEGVNAGTVYVSIADEKVYMTAGSSMNCIDIWTGERLWRSPMEAGIGISSFVVKEGKVIGQDESATVYAWNAETGTELWKVAGAGTSSRLRYLNGIVYFSGGSTSRIHAIDISTGKTVWLLDASKMEKGADDFKPDIYAIEGKNGEKGKIVVCTPMNAYCVEAYQ